MLPLGYQPKCISDRLTPESYERIILLVMQNWKQMQSIILLVIQNWKQVQSMDEVIQFFLFCDRKFRDPLVHFLDWVGKGSVKVEIANEMDWDKFVNFTTILKRHQVKSFVGLDGVIETISTQEFMHGKQDMLRQQLSI